MAKLRMLVELDYDAELQHGAGKEEEEWFAGNILSDCAGELLLHSNMLGCSIGAVRILVVYGWPPNAEAHGRAPAHTVQPLIGSLDSRKDIK